MPLAIDHIFEMALLALKGNRFEEAAALFTDALRAEPRASNWCGLGYAKTGLVYRDQASFDEVLHCFDRAIQAEPAQRLQVEAMCADAALRVMGDLGAHAQACRAQAHTQNGRMILSGLVVGVGATVGLSRRNTLFTNGLGLAGVAGGAGSLVHAHSQAHELRLGHAQAITLYRSVHSGCSTFLTGQGEPAKRFRQETDALLERFPVLHGWAEHRGAWIIVLGALGLILPGLGLLFAIPACVMGVKDLLSMRAGRMDPAGRGRTLMGLVLGVVGLWLAAFLFFGRSGG